MRRSTQSPDVLSFGNTIGRLALAPLPGAVWIAGWMQPPLGLGALLGDLLLVPFLTLFCYGAALVFVAPIMAIWAPSRRPSYLDAAIWGTLSASSAAAALFGVRESVHWESMRVVGVAGCASGLFYAYLARRRVPTREDGLKLTD